MTYFSFILIIAGTLLLLSAVRPGFLILKSFSSDSVKRKWKFLISFDILLILIYIYEAWNQFRSGSEELSPSVLLFLAALFISALVHIALKTLRLAKYIHVIEEDNTTDKLMEIYTRKYFDRRFPYEWEQSQLQDYPLSLLLINLDKFHDFNENYGQKTGDLILKKLSLMVKTLTRNDDFIARYSGDEIIIALPKTSIKGAMVLASRILLQITMKLSVDEEEGQVSVSIGAAECDGIGDLMSRVKRAMEEAKKLGGNRVVADQYSLEALTED